MSYYSKKSRNVRRNYVIIAIVSAIISALVTYFITKPEEETNAPTGDSTADRIKECSLCSVFKCNPEIRAMENVDKTDILEVANTLKDYTLCACSNCNEECLGVDSIQGITELQCNLVSSSI